MLLRLLAGLIALPAPAFALTLDLPGEAERSTVTYACADGVERAVEYVNIGGNGLALLEIDGERRVFVDVIAASGARYAGGRHVWWTKGEEATLFDETAEGDPVTCEAKDEE